MAPGPTREGISPHPGQRRGDVHRRGLHWRHARQAPPPRQSLIELPVSGRRVGPRWFDTTPLVPPARRGRRYVSSMSEIVSAPTPLGDTEVHDLGSKYSDET